MDLVTPPGKAPYRRCATCGVDDRQPAVAAALVRRPCKVEDCAGELDAAGACPCCAKRAAYEELHAVKRQCEICGGTITGRGGRKFCGACSVIAHRVYARKYAAQATKKKGSAARG